MVKTEMVRARVTPELKRTALKVPEYKLENSANFDDDRIDAEIERGYASYRAGKARPLVSARAAFQRRHGVDAL